VINTEKKIIMSNVLKESMKLGSVFYGHV